MDTWTDLRQIYYPRAAEIVRDYDQWVADRNRAYEQAYRQEGVEIDGPDQLNDAMHAVIKRIIATPAHTIDGMEIKARAMFYCTMGDVNEDEYDALNNRCAKSIVKDLLRMQGIVPMTDHEYAAKYHRPLTITA